ncbi:hypothetical protein Hanom_Chr12g01175181 [Helianthus anomalus]
MYIESRTRQCTTGGSPTWVNLLQKSCNHPRSVYHASSHVPFILCIFFLFNCRIKCMGT